MITKNVIKINSDVILYVSLVSVISQAAKHDLVVKIHLIFQKDLNSYSDADLRTSFLYNMSASITTP